MGGFGRDSIACVTEGHAEPELDAETGLTTESHLQLSRVGDVIVISSDALRLPESLSESEQEVAHAVIAGHSNAEIAKARGTSAKTVANQLYTMYRKLEVGTREELVALLVGCELSKDDRP
jgi:DNA-binding CsgD family transcriptional regulator